MVKSDTDSAPLKNKMTASKGAEISSFTMEAGGAIVSCKDTVTFTKKKK